VSLNAGALIHDVTIQQIASSEDTSGAPTETPSTLIRARMSREVVSGKETFGDAQLSAASVIRWQMRYVSSMDPDLVDVPKTRRLLYQGRSYDITEAENMDRRCGIVLTTLNKSQVAA
jgi:head-tail adaptor